MYLVRDAASALESTSASAATAIIDEARKTVSQYDDGDEDDDDGDD